MRVGEFMTIGKLIEVDIRELWAHEQYDFSNWLSKSENIEESKQISLNNYELEQKEIQIQKQIQQKQKQDKIFFDNNFDTIKQQFINSNNPNNDLLI